MTKDEVELVRKLAARVQHNDRGYDGYDESLPSCGGLIDGSSGAWIKPCTCGLQPLLDQLERLTVEPPAPLPHWRLNAVTMALINGAQMLPCPADPVEGSRRVVIMDEADFDRAFCVNRQAAPEAGRCPTCSRWLEQRCPVCGPITSSEPSEERREELRQQFAEFQRTKAEPPASRDGLTHTQREKYERLAKDLHAFGDWELTQPVPNELAETVFCVTTRGWELSREIRGFVEDYDRSMKTANQVIGNLNAEIATLRAALNRS